MGDIAIMLAEAVYVRMFEIYSTAQNRVVLRKHVKREQMFLENVFETFWPDNELEEDPIC